MTKERATAEMKYQLGKYILQVYVNGLKFVVGLWNNGFDK